MALLALTPQPLIGHAKGVVAGSICFGDRILHTYVGTAAGLSQGVDEELLPRDFADEDELMAMTQEAMTVADKDWQGIFQNFARDGRPPDDEKVRAQVFGDFCTCGSLVAKWKCEVGAHLGRSCALRCLCACLLCFLHAR